ncbi:reverse transcriptase (RNA-dependent DNA polymerase) domain-containing protein [Phthorimaea operculella]|nr:reverse transcriptase (RNA-dependent DNA polymerase) domain-containing protein [Phthorimaea operculella]
MIVRIMSLTLAGITSDFGCCDFLTHPKIRYRNFYNELRKKLKTYHDSSKLRENQKHPRKLWTTINEICSLDKKPNNSSSLLKTSASPKDSLNNCNSFFANVGEKLAEQIKLKIGCTEDDLIKSVPCSNDFPHSFFMSPTNTEEVELIIRSLNQNSAPGDDGINSSLLKSIFPVIAEPLTHIFNASLSSGVFPDCWKHAVVIPIHKAGAKDIPTNYRPISLLSIFSKILEKLVNRRLIKYLDKHKIISPCQFGFQSGKSTEDAIGLLLDTVKAESGMSLVSQWLNKNLLTLNTSKTKFMCFHKTIASAPSRTMSSNLNVHTCSPSLLSSNICDCGFIERTNELKYLGVTLDEQLSFKKHIRVMSGRVRKLIGVMKLLRDCADQKVLRLVYVALCQSLVTYCIGLWGSSAKTSIIMLERAQRSVLKVLYKKPFRYTTYLLYQEAQVLTIRQLYILKASLDQHKSVLKLSNSEQSSLSQRRVYHIKTPKVNSTFAQRFRSFSFPYIYSVINRKCSIKDCNLAEAKRKMVRWLNSLDYDSTEALLSIII